MGARLFLSLRWRLTPYLAMSRHLPRQGNILDLGCGHGLLALALALESPERKVIGIDHDSERVRAANQAALGMPMLSFREGNVLDPVPGTFSGIAMIDVMHYFEPGLQRKIFTQAFSALAPGGTLI